MKEFKGTKGEWEVYKANPKMVLTDLGAYKPSAIMLSTCDKKEMLSNAKLIAAAPLILYALQDLVRYCEENETHAELELAKEAINKAL